MILEARSGLRGLLLDADSGRPVRRARWADLETGEYECLRVDAAGEVLRDARGRPLTVRGRARLRFVPAAPLAPAKPSDPKDLAGSLEEARRRYAKPILAVPGRGCEEPRCGALATWETADERVIEPHVGPDGISYERAVTVERHRYCGRHYRPPVQISARGVESEVPVKARPE